jgi:hypothetical protein
MCGQPAGWYPDPESADPRITRYWDGAAWTRHRQAPPGVFVPEPPKPPETVRPPEVQRKRRRRVRIFVVVGVLIVGGGIAAAMVAARNNSPSAQATRACKKVLDAGRKEAAGTISSDAFGSVVSSADGTLDGLSSGNAKFLNIRATIYNLNVGLTAPTRAAGTQDELLTVLANECG